MNEDLTISPIQNEYASPVVDLILNIQQNEFNVPITLEDQPDLLAIKEFYYATGGCFWGAFIDQQLIGTIAVIKFGERSGAIRKMFVKQEFRGKELSVAQKLLDTLLEYGRKNGIENLYLGTVTVLKAALRFYERNGFTPIAKEELPQDFPLMSADTVFRQLTLIK